MRLLRGFVRARLGRRVARRLRRAGLPDVRFDRRAFQVTFRAAEGEGPAASETPAAPVASAAPPKGAVPDKGAKGKIRTTKHRDKSGKTVIELASLLATRPRKGRIDRFVAGLLLAPGLPQDWPSVKPLLRPVLRGTTPGSPLRKPVLPFLNEFVVVDQPDTMTYVSPEQLAGWGVTAEQVFAAAHANLSGAVLQGTATGPTVVRFVDDGDAYWTSHLLLQHWLGRLSGQVGGRPVAFAPERGTLLVTAAEGDHLAALFANSEEIYARSSRPITPMAYVAGDDGCTIAFSVEPGHPLAPVVRRAERVLAVSEYARQAAHLPDKSLAPLTLHGDRTRTHWPDEKNTKEPTKAEKRDSVKPEPERGSEEHAAGKDSTADGAGKDSGKHGPGKHKGKSGELLPEADDVVIDGEVCPWAAVVHRLTRVELLDPPRWRVTADE